MRPGARRFDLINSFDVVQARQCAREMAREIGFGLTDQTRIATAVSELATRAITSRNKGSLRFIAVTAGRRQGLECTCLGGEELKVPSDRGNGILSEIQRLVDEFAWEPGDGAEVTVVMRKWLS